MSRVLIAWELGSGWGHIVPALPLVERLRSRGHQVVFAMHDISRAALGEAAGAECIKCPSLGGPLANQFPFTADYSQVLFNVGFGDAEVLRGVEGWSKLLEERRPDFVLCDHSPTALLALRATGIKRALIGIGFCCPPPSAFESPLLEDQPVAWDLRRDEAVILANANWVLKVLGCAPLARMVELFTEVDEIFLTTFAELDHFPRRGTPRYYGALTSRLGAPVEWPDVPFPKVFVYTRDFPALEGLLHYISRSQLSAIVYSEEPRPTVRQATVGEIRFPDRAFDLAHVASTCDLAITNGNHGTTSAILLAGKPVLVIPTVTEQYMLGQRVEALGGGGLARPDDLDAVIGGLLGVLRDGTFSAAARRFQMRYAHINSDDTAPRIVDRIEQLVGC
ncbi:MAG: hypothetical protein WD894_09175 [Pirellulales bacterium]